MKTEKVIGVGRATALVAGNMVGSGVLLAPAILAPYGSWSLVGWILTTLGALCLALTFSRLSRWIPKSGGPYTYVNHVFGDFVGFQSAWGTWISAWCGSVSLLIGAIQYLSIFWPELASNKLVSIAIGLAFVWLFTFINLRGLKTTTLVEMLIVTLKIAPLFLIALAGLFCTKLSTVFSAEAFPQMELSELFHMGPVLLWAFIGIESATIPSDKIQNPSKTIPRATLLGVLLTASVYILGAIAINGLLPRDLLLQSQAPYVDTGYMLMGDFGRWLMAITGVIGIVGSLNGWILIQGQVPLSAAEEGLFPACFAKTNKNGTPLGVIIGSILMSIVYVLSYQESLVKQIDLLINVSVFAMLLPYLYATVAALIMAMGPHKLFSKREQFLHYLLCTIAFIYSFFAIVGSDREIIYIGFIILLLSVPCYAFVKKNNKKQAAK